MYIPESEGGKNMKARELAAAYRKLREQGESEEDAAAIVDALMQDDCAGDQPRSSTLKQHLMTENATNNQNRVVEGGQK